MKLLVVLLLMLLPCFAAAQQKNQYDSIKDAKTAIDLLHNAVNKSPQKAIYFCQLAERKNEIQQYDSAIFYANHCIALLLKDKNNLLAARVLHAKGIAQYYLDDKVHAEENWRSALQWQQILELFI
jgi:tetratricopeptide (TPR) repeat protein